MAWIALIALSATGAVFLFLPRWNRLVKMRSEMRESRLAIADMEDRIRELRENQHRFRTDAEFVERMARERGMIKPHEKTFRVLNRPTER